MLDLANLSIYQCCQCWLVNIASLQSKLWSPQSSNLCNCANLYFDLSCPSLLIWVVRIWVVRIWDVWIWVVRIWDVRFELSSLSCPVMSCPVTIWNTSLFACTQVVGETGLISLVIFWSGFVTEHGIKLQNTCKHISKKKSHVSQVHHGRNY